MTQVSKRPLHKKFQDRAWDLFVTCIKDSNNQNLVEELITDLLTPTERIMLTKRFSINYMLLNGYEYRTIAKALKVSTSTVTTTAGNLKRGGDGLRKIISKIDRNEKWETMISEFNFILQEHLLKAPIATGRRPRSLAVKRIVDQKPF